MNANREGRERERGKKSETRERGKEEENTRAHATSSLPHPTHPTPGVGGRVAGACRQDTFLCRPAPDLGASATPCRRHYRLLSRSRGLARETVKEVRGHTPQGTLVRMQVKLRQQHTCRPHNPSAYPPHPPIRIRPLILGAMQDYITWIAFTLYTPVFLTHARTHARIER
ncbi:hypothetical protein C0Q70_10626 [Pomacea canaliculata]|uniref:Uncharacterized protein n=1 Tax=Pomacea canaliculata TaxID=400727 RepID=A0A2T7P3P3_POMCA|nr:hypothetical protein C0Q70_10626 [Pomacea canaliculata]